MLILTKLNHELEFPNTDCALEEPNGLLAFGGDLTVQRLLLAYSKGIFPWFSDGQPILWWSPSKRAIIEPASCHISKSMKKLLKKNNFTVTINHVFSDVIAHCASPRASQAETWITDTMRNAYIELHKRGVAHSVEVWQEGKLVGGLYGIAIGTLFCGESMFSSISNCSKIAFIALNQHLSRFPTAVIDCQMHTAHLASLGVKEISREQFIDYLQQCGEQDTDKNCWSRQEISVKEKITNTGDL